MFEALLIILALLYAVVSIKVDEWITISALGFKTETPMMFLQNPKLYEVVRSVLFLGAVVSCFGMKALSWYVGLIALAVIWLTAGSIGRKKAFARYRQVLKEMVEFAETPEEKEKYDTASRKTNEELMDMVQTSMKMGI